MLPAFWNKSLVKVDGHNHKDPRSFAVPPRERRGGNMSAKLQNDGSVQMDDGEWLHVFDTIGSRKAVHLVPDTSAWLEGGPMSSIEVRQIRLPCLAFWLTIAMVVSQTSYRCLAAATFPQPYKTRRYGLLGICSTVFLSRLRISEALRCRSVSQPSGNEALRWEMTRAVVMIVDIRGPEISPPL